MVEAVGNGSGSSLSTARIETLLAAIEVQLTRLADATADPIQRRKRRKSDPPK